MDIKEGICISCKVKKWVYHTPGWWQNNMCDECVMNIDIKDKEVKKK